MNKRFNCVLGLIDIHLLSILNTFVTLPLFIIMLVEQIRIGVGTNLEMGSLIVWTIQAMCFFPFTVAVFFFVVSIFKRDYWHKIIINAAQITLFIVLNVLTIVWMFI